MDSNNIKEKTLELFVKKECNLAQPHVLGAIITTASKMAIPSDLVSESETVAALSEAFGVTENEKVQAFVGMGSQYVESITGWSIDYNDRARAQIAYEAKQGLFNSYYTLVSSYISYLNAAKAARETKKI